MSASAKEKRDLAILGGLLFVLIIVIGLIFADKSSDPVYADKIDKIMFDKENKAPKFVITIPDKEEIQKIVESVPENKEKNNKTQEEHKEISLQDVLGNAPTLNKLKPAEGKTPLRYIDNNSGLTESIDGMLLPKISPSNKKPWVEYGGMVKTPQNFFKVAIVIKDMGMDKNVTNTTIDSMPSNVSLAFSPYGQELPETIKKARSAGHETYTEMFLASEDLLKMDSGPLALGRLPNSEEMMKVINKTIAPGAPIGGVVLEKGLINEQTIPQISKALEVFAQRGLLLLDTTENKEISEIKINGLARQKTDIFIKGTSDKAAIAKQLKEAEMIAAERGDVVITAEPKPVALVTLKEWVETFSKPISYEEARKQNIDIKDIERPFFLVPLSSIVVE